MSSDGHAHHAAGDEQRVLAGVEHARQVVERGVGVGAAHAFVQGRDQVVVAVLALVVERRAPLHDLGETAGVQNLAGPCRAPDLLGERQHGAAVPVGHADQRRARRPRRAAAVFPTSALGALDQRLERLGVERAKDEDARAGKQAPR